MGGDGGMGAFGMPGGADVGRMQQQLMQNPDLIRNMISNNPQMRQVLDTNPQLNHVLNDPELMRQTLDALRNPAQMREMMRNRDLALSHLENHPEGFQALRRMYEDVQEPLMQATADAAPQPGGEADSAAAAGPSSGAAPWQQLHPWGTA